MIQFRDIAPCKFSVLVRFGVFLETSLESVLVKRAQREVESPEGKRKKKRKSNERRNQSAQKKKNPEENEDKIQEGECRTTLIIKDLDLANLFQVNCFESVFVWFSIEFRKNQNQTSYLQIRLLSQFQTVVKPKPKVIA